MAFQDQASVRDYLRREAALPDVSRRAVAENFLLEERLSLQREQQFVSARIPPTASSWDWDVWQVSWKNHYERRIKLRRDLASRVATFNELNRSNWLEAIEPQQDVIRIHKAH